MSRVPERSTVMGIPLRLTFSNTQYVNLKPAQKSLERDYYTKSTRNVPDAGGYSTNFIRFDTVYNDTQNINVKPKDYLVRNIGANNLGNLILHYSWI